MRGEPCERAHKSMHSEHSVSSLFANTGKLWMSQTGRAGSKCEREYVGLASRWFWPCRGTAVHALSTTSNSPFQVTWGNDIRPLAIQMPWTVTGGTGWDHREFHDKSDHDKSRTWLYIWGKESVGIRKCICVMVKRVFWYGQDGSAQFPTSAVIPGTFSFRNSLPLALSWEYEEFSGKKKKTENNYPAKVISMHRFLEFAMVCRFNYFFNTNVDLPTETLHMN